MKTLITAWHESAQCVWCEKDKETVSVEFGDGFLTNSKICWRCLQKAIRVRARNRTKPNNVRAAKTPTESSREDS